MNVNGKPGNLFLHLLSGYTFFLASTQILTISSSLLHWQLGAVLAWLILFSSAAAGIAVFVSGWKKNRNAATARRGQRGRGFFLAFLVLAAILVTSLFLAGWVSPDLSWDGNAYHIPTIAMWDIQGNIHWVETTFREPIINGYPKGAEVMAYVLVKALGNGIINTVNLWFLPLGVLGIAFMALELGAGAWLALCAGAAYAFIPIGINQAVTNYVDSALASAIIGMAALTLPWMRKDRLEWRNILAYGAALGLVLSIKGTGVMPGGISFLAVLGLLLEGRIRRMLRKGKAAEGQVKANIRILPAMLAVLGMAAATGGFWYGRDWARTGSPLYPVGLTLLGRTIFPGGTPTEAINLQINIPPEFEGMPDPLRVLNAWAQGGRAFPESIKMYDARLGGLGYLWILGCIPAMIIALIRLRKFTDHQKRIILLLLLQVGIAFAATPQHWWSRYTLWIYAAGLPIFALMLEQTLINPAGKRVTRAIAGAWLALCLGFLFYEAGYCLRNVLLESTPPPLRAEPGRFLDAAAWKWEPSYLLPDLESEAVDKILRGRETVAMGPRGEVDKWHYFGLVGELSQPIGARRLVFVDQNADSGSLEGAKSLFWDESVPLPEKIREKAVGITRVGGYELLEFP